MIRPNRLPLVMSPAVGVALVAYSYHLAAAGSRPFLAFWLGFALLMAPPLMLLCGEDDRARIPGLVAAGLLSAVPKLLRSPSRPIFSDEFAHMREVVNLTEGWDLFVSNAMVRMASEFPGMHRTVASFADTFGIPAWPAAAALITTAHLLLVVGVFALASRYTSSRSAGLAAAVYMTNPSFMLFHMQVAYESFALPLAVWTLVLLLFALDAEGRARATGSAAALVLAASVLVSHHLTMLALAGTSLLAVSARLLGRRGGVSAGMFAAAAAAVAAAAAAAAAASGRLSALGRYLEPSLRVFDAPSRMPFSGSTLPSFEIVAGLLLPFVIVAVILAAFVRIRPYSHRLPFEVKALAGLALLLPVSFPLVLSEASAEGARRSWGWSYLGLALLVALAADMPGGGVSTRRAAFRKVSSGIIAAVLVVGGVAVSMNENYRFPGPWQTAVDARSQPEFVWQLADRLAPLIERGDLILADRFVRGPLALAAPGVIVAPSDANPVWDVLFEPYPSEASQDLLRSSIRFVVVDRRMADRAPGEGFWFNRGERPGSRLAAGAFDLLDGMGDRVAVAGPYVVWRIEGPGSTRVSQGMRAQGPTGGPQPALPEGSSDREGRTLAFGGGL